MTLKIDPARCTGCPRCVEPPCVRSCPGDLLTLEEGGVQLRHPGDCWDCASCVKVCPRSALSLCLGPELGGRGSALTAHAGRTHTLWLLTKPDGVVEPFETAAVAAANKEEMT